MSKPGRSKSMDKRLEAQGKPTEGNSARELAERCVKVAKHYPSVAKEQSCENVKIESGSATSAKCSIPARDGADAKTPHADDLFSRHTKAVSDFLNELYAVMVDPCAEGTITVAEMQKELLEAAKRDRESAHLHAQAVAQARVDAITQCAIEAGERSPEGVSSHTMLGDMWDRRIAKERDLAAIAKETKCAGYPTCDGDLSGEPHSPDCPAIAKNQNEGG